MKQKGCALARVEDVALQPCSARKVFKLLVIEGLGELTWACPLCSNLQRIIQFDKIRQCVLIGNTHRLSG